MKKISVENIEDGMILARDVCGSTGSALIGKGTKLTNTMGRRLKNWGISDVSIEGEEDAVENKPSPEVSNEEDQQRLKDTFSGVMQNPIMRELYTAVLNFKTHKNDA